MQEDRLVMRATERRIPTIVIVLLSVVAGAAAAELLRGRSQATETPAATDVPAAGDDDVATLRARLASAERELTALRAATRQAAQASGDDSAELRIRVAELEGELERAQGDAARYRDGLEGAVDRLNAENRRARLAESQAQRARSRPRAASGGGSATVDDGNRQVGGGDAGVDLLPDAWSDYQAELRFGTCPAALRVTVCGADNSPLTTDEGGSRKRGCVSSKAGVYSGRQSTRVRTRGPVVWMADVREPDRLKPSTNPSSGWETSHRAVTRVNAKVAP